jgi:hypothetical protein
VTTIRETIAELADEARARPLVIVYWSLDGVVLDRLPFWTGHGAVPFRVPFAWLPCRVTIETNAGAVIAEETFEQ